MAELTIVTISKEPLVNVLRFVAWHHAMGASRQILYFSDPKDPAIPMLRDLPFVEPIACTPDFWRRLKAAEGLGFVGRQTLAMTDGYRRVRSGWVGVLDADELFYDEEGRLSDWLDRIRAEIAVLRLPVAEAISFHGGGAIANDQHFRMPLQGVDFSSVYGSYWQIFHEGAGTVGHFRGKSLARAGLDISRFRQHWPEGPDGRELEAIRLKPKFGRMLLHYFEAGWSNWRAKIEWRLGSGSISDSLAAYLRSQEGPQRETLWRQTYEALHVFDEAKLLRLQRAGGLYSPQRDTLAPARAMFGAGLIDRLHAEQIAQGAR